VLISVPFSCESPVLGWLIPTVSLLVVRIVVLFLVWIAWAQRQRFLRNVKPSPTTSGWQRRVPIIPMISTWQTVGGIVLNTLFALNIVNARNGTSLFLGVILWMVPVCLIQAFTMKKVVGLGSKIFRFSGGPIGTRTDLSKSDQHHHISKFDQVLSLLGGVSPHTADNARQLTNLMYYSYSL
jgi:hypothetical protein